MNDTERSLKERLDQYYDWPCQFLFKFIVPRAGLDELLALFPDQECVRTRESAQGRYLSVTVEVTMTNGDEVLAVYRRAGTIDGIVSL